MKTVRVVFVDLDNTLYDWLSFFGPAFRGLCTRLAELSGQPVQQLYEEFKLVFTKHGSVEYSFALQELPSLRKLHPDLSKADIVNHYFEAVRVYQSRRRRYLRAYRDVPGALRELRALGVMVVAISDAHRFHVLNRLRQLRLLDLLDGVCCLEDHGGATPAELAQIRKLDPGWYDVKVQYEFILPEGLRKPSRAVLDWLVMRLGVAPEETIYVGDSLVKDIVMAREAGVYDCWAAYGTQYSPVDMATLVRVTNWPANMVRKVLNATPDRLGIQPSCVIDSFMDVIGVATVAPSSRLRGARIESRWEELPAFELGAESVARGPSEG